jgi:hypothetical protein
LPVAIVHRRRVLSALVVVALTWSAASSMYVFPHSLSYFNELIGGPSHGHFHLNSSNVDWGQDLWYLRSWYRAHPESRPLHLGYRLPFIDPCLFGIEYEQLPRGRPGKSSADPKIPQLPSAAHAQLAPRHAVVFHVEHSEPVGPLPGWFILSVSHLHEHERNVGYFLEFEPTETIGYSMNVYHVTREQADLARLKLGLPKLNETSAYTAR